MPSNIVKRPVIRLAVRGSGSTAPLNQTLVTWGSTVGREGETWEFRVITICGEEESPPTAILSHTWAHPPRSPSFQVCTDARVELRWSRPTTQSYFTLLRYEIEFYTDSAYTVQRRSPLSSTSDISGSSSWRAWTGAYNPGETAYMRVRVWVSYTGASGEWPSRWVGSTNTCTVPGNTPTNTSTSTPTRTMVPGRPSSTPTATATATPTATVLSSCQRASNFRTFSTSNNGYRRTYSWNR